MNRIIITACMSLMFSTVAAQYVIYKVVGSEVQPLTAQEFTQVQSKLQAAGVPVVASEQVSLSSLCPQANQTTGVVDQFFALLHNVGLGSYVAPLRQAVDKVRNTLVPAQQHAPVQYPNQFPAPARR